MPKPNGRQPADQTMSQPDPAKVSRFQHHEPGDFNKKKPKLIIGHQISEAIEVEAIRLELFFAGSRLETAETESHRAVIRQEIEFFEEKLRYIEERRNRRTPIEYRVSSLLPTPLPNLEQLIALNRDIDETQAPFADRLGELLLEMEGESLGSFEANQRLASMIQDTAARLRMAFECPTCGQPARLRCKKYPRAQNGMFVFEHAVKRTNHGGATTVPPLKLIFNG